MPVAPTPLRVVRVPDADDATTVADDDEDMLPVRLVPPATAAEEAEAWQRHVAVLAWLVRQQLES